MTTTNTSTGTEAGIDLDKLEALALAYVYEDGDHWYSEGQLSDGITYEPAVNFIRAATPAKILDLIALARRAAPDSAASASGEPKAVQIFTCKGKGGEYELIGYSNGAGPKRGESIVVYRDVTTPDVFYHRSADDFRDRMEWQGARASCPIPHPVVAVDERALFEAAIDTAYPIPDSPHTSVMQRTNDSRAAFTKGWEQARASLAPVAAQQGAAKAAIPPGVYYSIEHGNFYSAGTNMGMGTRFYSNWIARNGEFPASAPEATQAAHSLKSNPVDGQKAPDLANKAGTAHALQPAARALPTNDQVYAEVRRQRGSLPGYVSTNAVNDVMAAVRSLGAAPAGEGEAPSAKQEKLRALADRIDHEQLWQRPAIDRDRRLTDDQRDRLDAGVMLRRYADLMAPGRWLVLPPTGNVQFSAGTLDKVTEMAKRDQDRRAAQVSAHQAKESE